MLKRVGKALGGCGKSHDEAVILPWLTSDSSFTVSKTWKAFPCPSQQRTSFSSSSSWYSFWGNGLLLPPKGMLYRQQNCGIIGFDYSRRVDSITEQSQNLLKTLAIDERYDSNDDTQYFTITTIIYVYSFQVEIFDNKKKWPGKGHPPLFLTLNVPFQPPPQRMLRVEVYVDSKSVIQIGSF